MINVFYIYRRAFQCWDERVFVFISMYLRAMGDRSMLMYLFMIDLWLIDLCTIDLLVIPLL